MKDLKITLLALIALASIPAMGMEQAPQAQPISFDALPGDVKRIIIPLIASSKVAEVANAVR